MRFGKYALAASAALASACIVGRSPAAMITRWDFNSNPIGVSNSPEPSIGMGTATPLGITNNYTYSTTPPVTGSIASADVLAATGSSDPISPSSADNVWRVRGANPGNGWNLAAPQYSQGAEFDASTVGHSNVVFQFDWFSTNQGVRDMQEQYTTDGSTWTNVGPLLIATPNGWNNSNVIDFAALGIHSVDNNPNFGVRLVSAYDPAYTGAGAPTYTSATLGANGAPAPYNNNSGNWRFDEVSVSGSPVPEPASLVTLTLLGGLMIRRRGR